MWDYVSAGQQKIHGEIAEDENEEEVERDSDNNIEGKLHHLINKVVLESSVFAATNPLPTATLIKCFYGRHFSIFCFHQI